MLGAVAAALVTGCGEQPDTEFEDSPDEDPATAAQALGGEATCVTVKRGVFGDIHDAMLSGDHPTWRAGDEPGMWTGLSSGGNENRALLQLDLDFVPPYAIVTSATLKVFVGWTMYSSTIRAHEVLTPWHEETVTNASFPAGGFDPAPSGSYQAVAGTQGYQSLDFTALAKAWLAGTKENHGVLLEEDPVVGHYHHASDGSASRRPTATVCYVNGPKPRRGGALVAAGTTSDSESYRFIGSLGEGPGDNHVGTSETRRFVGGLVGATQE